MVNVYLLPLKMVAQEDRQIIQSSNSFLFIDTKFGCWDKKIDMLAGTRELQLDVGGQFDWRY